MLRAQQGHDVQRRPKRALFEAYEAVFAENGLDTRQDRACLRILLQLCGPQIPGDLLYDKFEFVLRQIGVNLAFGDDESGSQNDQQAAARSYADDETADKRALLLASPRRPRRRASFTSMHDVTVEQSRLPRQGRLSRASESWLQNERAPLQMVEQKEISANRYLETNPNQQRRASHGSQDPKRNGMNGPYNEQSLVPKPESPNYARLKPGVEEGVYGRFQHHEISTDSEPRLSPRKRDPRGSSYPLSITHLNRDAEAFEDMRLRNLQRKLLIRWLRRFREHSQQIRALELQAAAKDFLTLKRQALDFWRSAYKEKHQQVLEDRFFEHLHARAGQAYDLYLLTKSFTHWIQIAAAGVAKTDAARQRFLFTKYFNTWYRFTVTNELKAKRQGLRAPFDLLRRRAAHYYRDQVNALEVYHGNLTKFVFWRWFREWCDRAAPRYREQQLQLRTFSKWLRTARGNRSREAKIDSNAALHLLQKVMRSWATKARIDLAGFHQAEAFRKSHLLRTPLVQWHAEAKLRPVVNKVSHMQEWRIARASFGMWQLRTRMVFRADSVDVKRTLQNAYTAWNERLRSRALAARTNERIVAEALYKWVIAQRFALMNRISEQHKKGRAMRMFLAGIRERWKEFSSKEKQQLDARKKQLLRLTLDWWRERNTAVLAQSGVALDFYNPKLKQDAVEAIRLKIRANRKLEIWAKDARFYFLMTRYVAIWRAASAVRKKSRERAAHTKMRRKCKLNLARNLLRTWSHRRRERLEACRVGDETHLQKIRALQQVLFRDWQATASQRQQETFQSSTRYDHRLLDHSLGLLVDSSRHLQSLQSRAEKFHHLKISEVCSAELRRFSMRAFEIRRRERDAAAMLDRHWNKHVRNMLRHWASKTQDSVYTSLVGNAHSEKAQEREPTDAGYGTASNEEQAESTYGNDLGATGRAEEWTAFDTDLLERSEWISHPDDEPIAASTPLPAPGYLNTPSKRAARAKALAHLSTTPATPSRTPFTARLRAGIGATPSAVKVTTARRGGLGIRSALGSNVKNSEDD